MKKTVLFLLAACMMLTLVGCGGEKTYRIAVNPSYAPFVGQNEAGEYYGIGVDILTAIAQEQGFSFTLQGGTLEGLGTQACDAVLTADMAEATGNCDMSEALYKMGTVMVTAVDNVEIQKLEDLTGKTVGVLEKSGAADFAESVRSGYGFSVLYFDDRDAMYADVRDHACDACFDDVFFAEQQTQAQKGLRCLSDTEQGASTLCFAVKKGKNKALIRAFKAGLEGLKQSGKLDAIQNQTH